MSILFLLQDKLLATNNYLLYLLQILITIKIVGTAKINLKLINIIVENGVLILNYSQFFWNTEQ